MTREERFNMDMIDEFKQMCEILEKDGKIIYYKHRMSKALKQYQSEVEATKLQKNYNKGFEDCRQAVLDVISRIGLHKSGTKEVQAVAEWLRAVEFLTPCYVTDKDAGKGINNTLTGRK